MQDRLATSLALAQDGEQSAADRAAALETLGAVAANSPDLVKDYSRLATAMLVPTEPLEVQTAAVAGLSRFRQRDAAKQMLAGWTAHGTSLRRRIVETLLSRKEWVDELLKALEQKRVFASDVELASQQRLLNDRNESVRKRAESVFAERIDSNRQAVLDSLAQVATMDGDLNVGEAIFRKRCASCHR